MKEERLRVLKMVEDGKISVEDAMKLLDALKATEHDFRGFEEPDFEDRLNKFSQSVDGFAKEFGDKVGNVFKDMEPRLRQATKTVVEKTVNVVDEISKSLSESLRNMEERAEGDEKQECEADEKSDDEPKEN